MLDIALRVFPESSHVTFATALHSSCFYPHFMEEKTEAWEVEVPFSRSWTRK